MSWPPVPATADTSLATLLIQRARVDPARPLVTFVHRDGDGHIERMELSAASLANGAAKAAGLLRDELDVQAGDPVSMDLPLHWQASVWAGALGLTGACARPESLGDEVVTVVDTARASSIDGAEVVGVSLAAFGMPCGRDLPAHVIEAAVAARAHADVFAPHSWPEAGDIAVELPGEVLTQSDSLRIAQQLADSCDLRSGGRLLVTDTEWQPHTTAGWLLLLAVPLVVDAAVVFATRANTADEPPDVSKEGITARFAG